MMPREIIDKMFDIGNGIFSNGEKGERPMAKIPAGIYLLRKSKTGDKTPVLNDRDFPARFQFSGRHYVISRTKQGKLIMTTEDQA